MSARHRHRRATAASPAVFAAALLALAFALAACGIKSAPKHPEGSAYPQEYPASGDAKAATKDKAQPDIVPPLVPQYDYPNRPPPR